MSDEGHMISVQVFDRTYQIKCPTDEAAQLHESAKYLDAEMRKINQRSQSKNTERLAIVAALNIAHELMYFRNQKNVDINTMHDHIKSLQQRIKHFLESKDEVSA